MDLTNEVTKVTICENGSICCGAGQRATDCCNMKQGLFVVNGSAVPVNPISFQDSLSLSSTSSITSFTRSEPLNSATSTKSFPDLPLSTSSNIASRSTSFGVIAPTKPSPSSSTSLVPSSPNKAAARVGKTRRIVGGVTGGSVAVLVVVGALIWKQRFTRRKLKDHNNATPRFPNEGSVPDSSELHAESGCQEMDGADPIVQLDPSRIWHEMS